MTEAAEKIPVLAIAGPTATGKTGLAVALAKRFDAEVLSFDSMQLYKGMDVATAKPTPEEMDGVPHHMIDCVDPSETFSVAKYKAAADAIIDDIRARGKQVIMVGGTGLYLDAVLQNIELLDIGDNTEVRAALQNECDEQGLPVLYERLKTIDPEYAEKVDPNNASRVIRALEVYTLTGYTMSYQIARSRETPSRYRPLIIGLTAKDRNYLYTRIDRRVDQMVEQGLLDEAAEVLEHAPGETAAQAIGIKEVLPYLRGEETLSACLDQLKTATRRYAKRQLTWFRREPDITWIFIDECGSPDAVAAEAERIVLASGLFGDR